MRVMRRRCITFALVTSILAGASHDAWAGDAEGARAHFEAGKKLRDDGDCAKAIPEFDKSLAADKSIGAFYNLGFCHEQLGHRMEAYNAYKRAQELASQKKDDRLKEIGGAIASLLETPHVRLILPQPIPPGTTITVDDQIVPEAFHQNETVVFTKNTKLHSVVITSPGYEDVRENVETKQLKAITLRRPTPKTEPAPPPAPAAPTETRWSTWHYVGVGTVAAGVITLGIGGYLGIRYLNDRSDLNERITRFGCGDDAVCSASEIPDLTARKAKNDSAEAKDLIESNNKLEKRGLLEVATPAIVGGVLLIGGLAMFLIAPYDKVESADVKKAATTTRRSRTLVMPQIAKEQAGLAVAGTF